MNQRINGREINQFYMFNIIKLMNSNKLKNDLKWMKNIIHENMSKNEIFFAEFKNVNYWIDKLYETKPNAKSKQNQNEFDQWK